MNCTYLAHLTINHGVNRSTVIEALKDVERLTQLEPGCFLFRVFETPNENELMIWEVFASEDALQEHYKTPYTEAYFKKGLTSVKSFTRLDPLQPLNDVFQTQILNVKAKK